MNNLKKALLGSSAVMSAVAFAAVSPAVAQGNDESYDEIVVYADPVGLSEETSSDSVFGVSRSLLETPRSVSIVSDTTMERYGIEDIDDFITTTPGTFGGSFFGVPGAISIRGSVSETYYRGFKRALNQGLFPTPIGSSDRVEIVRGPVPVIYGAGRVGGLLNFYPKTVDGEGITTDDGIHGSVSFTGGSYGKKNGSIELIAPFKLAGRESGISVYAEIEDSKHFYRGREPEHQLVQFAFSHELPAGMSFEAGGMYYHSDGYYQTPGWNRVTQDLIDNGTYITGRDTDLTDIDGNGRLTPNEVDAAVGTFFGASNIRTLVDFGVYGIPDAYKLDTGVGTGQLDRRTVFMSDQEIAESESFTGYVDLKKEFDDDSTLSLQLFYDQIDGDLFVSYGFAAQHEMKVFEARASYDFGVELGDNANLDMFFTASHRRYDAELRENFLSGYLVLDRRDLLAGPQGNDIFDSPFSEEPGGIGIGWDTDGDSRWTDTGVAAVADLKVGDLGIVLGGRYDHYDTTAIDTGNTVFDPSLANTRYDGKEGDFSYSASVNYTTPFGLVPYFTYAEGSELNDSANGGITPGAVRDEILFGSELLEGGVKFSLLDNKLFGSATVYKQERQRVDSFGNKSPEESKGFEFEMSYIITENWSMTGAATVQNYKIPAPGACGSGQGEYLVIPPNHPSANLFGSPVALEDGYGGLFAALNASCIPELQNGYDLAGIPDTVFSSFLTYTSDETQYGTFGATFGGTRVAETGGRIDGAIVLPAYTVFRAAAFADFGRFQVTATIDNLFDKTYFQPLQDVYQEVGALPGVGRTFQIKGVMNF
ncbi:TonB-dependent siderophore receptor [Hyphococcus sp. DH-69]|uniref:TonB-dependent siderophore receptor n=1 Tax=Hyphococcus formosus TaxID=3143534 RepID=UPI00398AEC82